VGAIWAFCSATEQIGLDWQESSFGFSGLVMAFRKVSVTSAVTESLFFASPKKSNQKKGDPSIARLRRTLRCSPR